jgi:hypothetical protein
MWNQIPEKVEVVMPQVMLINSRGRTISVPENKADEHIAKGFVLAPKNALLGQYYKEYDQAIMPSEPVFLPPTAPVKDTSTKEKPVKTQHTFNKKPKQPKFIA